MPFYYNGVEITTVFWNGVEMSDVYFNGTLVLEEVAVPTDWVDIGLSSYNGTLLYQNGLFCADSYTVDTWLTSNYPPGNYSIGYIFRVEVKTSGGGDCGYMYFEAQ